MNRFVAHIANGHVFFTGSAILILSVLLRQSCNGAVNRRLNNIAIAIGLVLVGLASTSFRIWFWGLAIGVLIRVLNCKNRESLWRRIALFVVVWSGGMLSETISQWTPQLAQDMACLHLPVVIVADSLTSGLGENEATIWPQLLAEKHKRHVVDLSHVGETAASALKRIRKRRIPDEAVVLVEIGGNDLLGGTTPENFERSLNELFEFLAAEKRTVFLFELPLPPFHGRWCKIQRAAAVRHNVSVIPRHQLTSVITGRAATFDSVHLTQEGHNRMLKVVEFVLRIAR